MQLVFQFNSHTSLADLGGLCDPSVVSVSPSERPPEPVRTGDGQARVARFRNGRKEELTQVASATFSNLDTTRSSWCFFPKKI